jgi:outer membrane protein
MKYFVKIFVVTFLLLFCTHTFAEQKIAYLDMTFILNNSKAGKAAQIFLKKTFSDNQKKYSDLEKKLKKEESDLLSKKEVITKEEYTKRAENLRNKVTKYQADRRKSLDKITKQRSTARKQLLNKLDPILKDFAIKNNISIIIDQKYIIQGVAELDVTNLIVAKLNKELPSLKLE